VAAIGCSPPSSRLDGRQFVCRAGKWHSPRGRLRTSIGCCPPVNIEPRCNIAPTTMIDAVVPREAGRATT
jgi:hypothetical protein